MLLVMALFWLTSTLSSTSASRIAAITSRRVCSWRASISSRSCSVFCFVGQYSFVNHGQNLLNKKMMLDTRMMKTRTEKLKLAGSKRSSR